MNYHKFVGWAALSMAQAGAATMIGNWNVAQGSPPTSGLATSSPVIGDGTINSADDVAIYAVLDDAPAQLAIGHSLQFSGTITLTGSASAANQFRFGLYYAATTSTTGWLGYMVDNGTSSTPGDLRERNAGNAGNFWLGNSTTDLAAASLPGGAFSQGTYQFALSVIQQANGQQIDWSLTRTGGGYAMAGSFFDSTPLTSSFNRAGMLIGNGLDADQVSFQNLTLTQLPECQPAVMLLGAGLFLIWRRQLCRGA